MRALAIMIAAVMFGPAQGYAAERTNATAPLVVQHDVTDFSAAKRKQSVRTAPAGVEPAVSTPHWTGADPTRGPGIQRLRELQREGRCVIDEGYGRYSSCSNV